MHIFHRKKKTSMVSIPFDGPAGPGPAQYRGTLELRRMAFSSCAVDEQKRKKEAA